MGLEAACSNYRLENLEPLIEKSELAVDVRDERNIQIRMVDFMNINVSTVGIESMMVNMILFTFSKRFVVRSCTIYSLSQFTSWFNS